MGSMIWPASRNSEVCVTDVTRTKIEWRRVSPTPKKLARKIVQKAAERGWTIQGRSKFHELRDDVGTFTYHARRRNPFTAEEELRDIVVIFPIAPETYTGPI